MITVTLNPAEFVTVKRVLDKLPWLGPQVAEYMIRTLRDMAVHRSAVDTGRLKQSWTNVVQVADGTYSFYNTAPYSPILEFGLYKGVGPKTRAYGDGIYSTQALGGMVRPMMENKPPAGLTLKAAEEIVKQ